MANHESNGQEQDGKEKSKCNVSALFWYLKHMDYLFKKLN